MESLIAASQIGAYQLLSPLGRGGMGEVHLALDTRLGRKVAVKLLPAEFTTDDGRVRRFAQEARAASALNHPNIVTIHEIGEAATESGSLRYIVTEYVEGETLRQRIARAPQKRIEPSEAIDIATQIAAALAAAHEAGITHRDIKPENVMARRDGIVKVLDFGLAKLSESAPPMIDTQAPTLQRVTSTESGVVMGTPRYMSPEQARGEKLDARTDIFSLGVMLYEMIAGRAPFAGTTPGEVIASILRDEPPPLAHFVADAPAELQRIINNALCKGREERYQLISEMLSDLKSLKQELEIEAKLRGRRAVLDNIITPNEDNSEASEIASLHTATDNRFRFSAIRHWKLQLFILLILLAIVGVVWMFLPLSLLHRSPSSDETSEVTGGGMTVSAQKLYWQMNGEEQTAFVSLQAQRTSGLLGERETLLNQETVLTIKRFVDGYAARADSLSAAPWEEGLRSIFGRASQYAPVIAKAFRDHGVPPLVGLYIPMVESEYRACIDGPTGAVGLFQIMPETALIYGLDPKDRCKVEKAAPVAAQYVADRITEFGSDATSMTLVLFSFNVSPDAVRRSLVRLRRSNPQAERSFWTLFANAREFDKDMQLAIMNYVPRFFAAAIIGENPQRFGLPILPLSAHTTAGAQ